MTEKQLWDHFRAAGLTEAGVAGLMGNLYHESGFRFNNLENSKEKRFGMTDDEYTIACDGGLHDFVHDAAGYGIAQWTYWSRKQNLLHYAKALNVSIADPKMQLDFLIRELLTGYTGVYNVLRTTNSVREASNVVLLQFERPADQSAAAQEKRYKTSQGLYDRLAAGATPKTVATRRFSPVLNSIVDFGTKKSNPRKNKVVGITMHHMAGVMTAEACARMHLTNGKEQSANIYVGNKGDSCGGVAEDRRAWTTGTGDDKGTNDHTHITFEVSNSNVGGNWPISDAAYITTVRLCAEICTYYGIKPHYDGTKKGTITMHKQFQPTACPGPYFSKLITSGQFERDIIAAMGDVPPSATLWRVQTGAFSNKDKAFARLNELRQKGMYGIVVLTDNLYKVQVGSFAQIENAERKKTALEDLGYDGFVTDKGGQMVVENNVITHIVKRGETLTQIAKNYGTSVAAIVAANGIVNPDVIRVGQKLVIV